MREINAALITESVKKLCIESNCHLTKDIKDRICDLREKETWAGAKEILDRIIENYEIADAKDQPVCQDTGVACVFLKIGQDVHVVGDITDAVNEGVRQGYGEGYLRKSVVRDPLDRVNTGDNTPAMIYFEIVSGDKIEMNERESRLFCKRTSKGAFSASRTTYHNDFFHFLHLPWGYYIIFLLKMQNYFK
jgi:fumarate hydratase subunit alpha